MGDYKLTKCLRRSTTSNYEY